MKKIILLIVIVLVSPNSMAQNIFDFTENADRAKWQTSTLDANSNALPNTSTFLRFGQDGGEAGIVNVIDHIMEDGKSYKVLYTHPRWSKNGAIKGWFPAINGPLPKNTYLQGQIGFMKPSGRPGTDGARFMIYAHHYDENGREKWDKIFDEYKKYTGSLINLDIPLNRYNGKKVFFELRVDSGEKSFQDWAAWVNMKVVKSEKTISLKTLTNLCPSTKNGYLTGPRDFESAVSVKTLVRLYASESRGQLYAQIRLFIRSRNKRTTLHSWVGDYVYSNTSEKITHLWDASNNEWKDAREGIGYTEPELSEAKRFSNRDAELPESGGELSIFGCNDGKEYWMDLRDYPFVESITIIGDTGGEDVSSDLDCGCDTRIPKIVFKNLKIRAVPR